jgi:hypothetical protein
MARLPQPGSDDGTWGQILNDYLGVAHDSGGAIKSGAVSGSAVQDDSISATKLATTNSPSNGQILGYSGSGLTWSNAGSSDPALGGDLSGTASNAQIVAGAVGTTELGTNAVTTIKITDANVTDAKIASGVSQSKITNLVSDLSNKASTTVTDGLNTRVTALESAGIVTLTDAATIATDASAGKHFRVSIGADRTLGVPTNPTDGMRRIWEVTASGADRSLTLSTGTAGSFELTTNITSPIVITNGKTQFLGAVYNSTRNRWTVLASQATS